MNNKFSNPATMTDNALLADVMFWIRIGRNEDGLKGTEQSYLKSICQEVSRRGLLKNTPWGKNATKKNPG